VENVMWGRSKLKAKEKFTFFVIFADNSGFSLIFRGCQPSLLNAWINQIKQESVSPKIELL